MTTTGLTCYYFFSYPQFSKASSAQDIPFKPSMTDRHIIELLKKRGFMLNDTEYGLHVEIIHRGLLVNP
jgi:hypothetical protein